MEMLIDLLAAPLVNECSERAAALLSVGHELYPRIREDAEKDVVEWQHSAADHYPLLDPIGPELVGLPRGELCREPVADGFSYGLDQDGVVLVKRHHTPEHGSTAHYHVPDSEGFEIVWTFDEFDEKDFHKCRGVTTSRVIENGTHVVVTRGLYGGERRVAYVVRGRSVRLHAISLTRRRTEPEEQYVAELDDLGRPLRITDPRTHTVHYERKERGDVDVARLLSRLGKGLAKEIPKLVEGWAAGREIDGVCLMHGDGHERFPPAVLPILSDAPERGQLPSEHAWEVWDPSPWLDVVDPIYFDQGVSAVVDEVYPDLAPRMLEETTQQAALQCIDQLVKKLGEVRWPRALRRREPFVVYRANYEEGDWRSTFLSVLPSSTIRVLNERGTLPPESDPSRRASSRGPRL